MERTTAKHITSHYITLVYFAFANALYLQFCDWGMVKYNYLSGDFIEIEKQIENG